MMEYAYLVPVFPFLAFVLNIIFGKRFREGGAYVSISTSTISFLISIVILLEAFGGKVLEKSWDWFYLGDAFEIGILIDPLSALMLFIVSFVSLLVLIYSLGYMHGDPGLPRYYAEISLFSCSMLGLVIANNLLQMFVFWELVGLCSYFLIGFWYERPTAAAAAKKAFIVTRIGDTFMLAGIIVLYSTFHTFNFHELIELIGTQSATFIKIVMLLIFGGAVGKSAQFPLHVWLPDAMEGPTTVSCLIHSATMVKAGVYLVARTFPMFEHSHEAMIFVAYIGGVTALIAGTMALVMTDIKRVLAYSTISHLGFMTLGLGVGSFTAGLFHLLNHSFFKALLFLSAGSIIHGVGTQDLREMGGLWKKMKITAIASVIGAWALSGLPPWSGFWSKDEILAAVYGTHDSLLFSISMIAALFSALYAFRWLFLIFGPTEKEIHAHESPLVMTFPLIILSVGALFSGFFARPFGEWIVGGLPEVLEHAEHEGYFVMGLSIAFAFLGFLTSFLIYYKKAVSPETFTRGIFGGIHRIIERKYYMDDIFTALGNFFAITFTNALNWFDRYIIDGIVDGLGKAGIFLAFKVIDVFDIKVIDGAVNGVGELSLFFGEKLKKIQTGFVQSYAGAVLLGIILLILIIKGMGG